MSDTKNGNAEALAARIKQWINPLAPPLPATLKQITADVDALAALATPPQASAPADVENFALPALPRSPYLCTEWRSEHNRVAHTLYTKESMEAYARAAVRSWEESKGQTASIAEVFAKVRGADGPTIDMRDITGVIPRGENPDECTLVMRSGQRLSVGSGYGKTALQSAEHWIERVTAAKNAALK